MRLPKSIPVMGKLHNIQETTEDDIDGCVDKGIIFINTKNIDPENPNDLMHTLLHEFFHAVTRRTGIYQAIPDELDEVIADSFATCLVEAFDIKIKKLPRGTKG